MFWMIDGEGRYAGLLQGVWSKRAYCLPRRTIAGVCSAVLPMQLCAMRPHLGSQPNLLPHPEPFRPGGRPFVIRPPTQFVQGPAAGFIRSTGRGILHVVVQLLFGLFKAFQLGHAEFQQRHFCTWRQVQVSGEYVDQQREAVAAFFKFFP